MFQGDNTFLLTIQFEEIFEGSFTAVVSITFGDKTPTPDSYR